MLVENKWSNLMKKVRSNRERRNSRVKLNMDLCLLQIENLYEANNENPHREDNDITSKLRMLNHFIDVYQHKYLSQIDGVEYAPLILMGELILNLYANK